MSMHDTQILSLTERTDTFHQLGSLAKSSRLTLAASALLLLVACSGESPAPDAPVGNPDSTAVETVTEQAN
ncbi:MAG: hypothetical protein Q8L38_10505, partial [Pseudohongiella sp.]|nr:hypothetical protein [Pseudohongiella sp.]